jgi:hypothetical protein
MAVKHDATERFVAAVMATGFAMLPTVPALIVEVAEVAGNWTPCVVVRVSVNDRVVEIVPV